jgi:small-conductance mechanosensitive channel
MSLFQQHWTPSDADEWTIHDLLASALSAISYILVGIGVAGALLLQLWGFIALGVGILSIVLMYLIIDPKLKAMSEAFAKRQQEFLEHVEKTTRWEE